VSSVSPVWFEGGPARGRGLGSRRRRNGSWIPKIFRLLFGWFGMVDLGAAEVDRLQRPDKSGNGDNEANTKETTVGSQGCVDGESRVTYRLSLFTMSRYHMIFEMVTNQLWSCEDFQKFNCVAANAANEFKVGNIRTKSTLAVPECLSTWFLGQMTRPALHCPITIIRYLPARRPRSPTSRWCRRVLGFRWGNVLTNDLTILVGVESHIGCGT
jgi:hypothetical protein